MRLVFVGAATPGGGRIYCTGIGIKASGWLRMRTCMNPSGPRPKLKPELPNIMIATRLTRVEVENLNYTVPGKYFCVPVVPLKSTLPLKC